MGAEKEKKKPSWRIRPSTTKTSSSSTLSFSSSSAYLVYHHGGKKKKRGDRKQQQQTFWSLSDGTYSIRSLPDTVSEMTCVASSESGWLVMAGDRFKRCLLWNPISMEQIDLPPNKIELPSQPKSTGNNWSTIYCVVTSSPPPNCVVMFISSRDGPCLYCRPGDKKWTEQALSNWQDSSDGTLGSIQAAVSCKDQIFMTFQFGYAIGILNTSTSTGSSSSNSFSMKLLNMQTHPCSLFSSLGPAKHLDYLVESCGEVYMVVKIYMGTRSKELYTLDVFRLNNSSSSSADDDDESVDDDSDWEKVESLGKDRVFLLGAKHCHQSLSVSCVSVSATKNGVREDCIFFYEVEREDKCLYAFDVKNRNMMSGPNIGFPHDEPPYWMLT